MTSARTFETIDEPRSSRPTSAESEDIMSKKNSKKTGSKISEILVDANIVTEVTVPELEGIQVFTFNPPPATDRDTDDIPLGELVNHREKVEVELPEWAQEANLYAVPKAEAKEPTVKKAKAAKIAKECTCGCGRSTLSMFAPGHDAKMAVAVAEKVSETDDVSLYEKLPTELLRIKAKNIAATLNRDKAVKKAKVDAKAAFKEAIAKIA